MSLLKRKAQDNNDTESKKQKPNTLDSGQLDVVQLMYCKDYLPVPKTWRIPSSVLTSEELEIIHLWEKTGLKHWDCVCIEEEDSDDEDSSYADMEEMKSYEEDTYSQDSQDSLDPDEVDLEEKESSITFFDSVTFTPERVLTSLKLNCRFGFLVDDESEEYSEFDRYQVDYKELLAEERVFVLHWGF